MVQYHVIWFQQESWIFLHQNNRAMLLQPHIDRHKPYVTIRITQSDSVQYVCIPHTEYYFHECDFHGPVALIVYNAYKNERNCGLSCIASCLASPRVLQHPYPYPHPFLLQLEVILINASIQQKRLCKGHEPGNEAV